MMAKKQTRRSVSLEKQLYLVSKDRAATLAESLSEYVSKLVRADLAAAGIEVPVMKRYVHASAYKRELAAFRATLPAEPQPGDPAAPKVAVARPVRPPKPVDKTKECGWCGANFKVGEIPTDHDGYQVHGKCKREILQTSSDVFAP